MMLPTRLIYKAAMTTPEIKIRDGKVVKYSDIEAGPVDDHLCWLCGGETNGEGVPTKKAIKPTFTDHALARAPESNSICKPCAWCLSWREMRNYSIIATGKWLMHPDRTMLRGWLIKPPDPPFVICAAVSGQKWLHIRAEIAHSRSDFPVQFEDTRIYTDPARLKEMLFPIEMLYSNGFSKAEIESGNYNQKRIIDYGLRAWMREEDKLREYRQDNRLFSLAVFVAREQEDLKIRKEDNKSCKKDGITITTAAPSAVQQKFHF